MKKICFFYDVQFGYHIDSYNYCEVLKDKYDLYYICVDEGNPKIELEGVKVIYLRYESKKFIGKRIEILKKAIKHLKLINPDKIFIIQVLGSSILNLFFDRNKLIYDIRTLCVEKSIYKRLIINSLIKIDTLFFKNITIISDGLAKKMILRKYNYLPLGANCTVNRINNYDNMRIIYVGTFFNRNIDKTIDAFELFIKNFNSNAKYTIIGDSSNKDEVDIIKNKIRKSIYKNQIEYLGYVENYKLNRYLEENNIGLAYIPIKKYYQDQPSTKVFEYLANGLICIATNTRENNYAINKENGIIIEDSIESIYKAFININNNFKNYDREKIMECSKKYNWKEIVDNYLIPILNN